MPSRTELSTALTVSTVPVLIENEEVVLTAEEIEEKEREIERQKEIEELNYYYTNKITKKIEKPKINTPTTGVGPTPMEPVPDSLRKSLCSNLRGTVGRLKALIPGWEGTTLHALTLLHRYNRGEGPGVCVDRGKALGMLR